MPAPQNYSTPAESPIPLEPAPFPTVYTLSLATQSLSTHIRITVNGVNVSALIDTGSSITLAAQNLCAALGVFTLDPPQSITAMGMAGIHVPMAGSKKVQLRISNICLQHTLHFTKGSCVPNIHSAYEVILGNDLLALLPTMTIDYQNHQVSFGQATLPLGQACTLNNWGEATDFTLVSQAMRLFQRDLSVAPAIINSKQPVLLVSNPTNQPQTLYAGMHIAKAMPLTKEIALTDHIQAELTEPPAPARGNRTFVRGSPELIDFRHEQQRDNFLRLVRLVKTDQPLPPSISDELRGPASTLPTIPEEETFLNAFPTDAISGHKHDLASTSPTTPQQALEDPTPPTRYNLRPRNHDR
ncbi:unnamed protein product [Haemonchus placei]|uniref:Peptidase A2 domain-containing protein n=1 Tax=Haemonchus placei TaxID=6290 RepID=A0A0N4W374_HAEPC|nr:unnamed protein product [Haemonchus placei]